MSLHPSQLPFFKHCPSLRTLSCRNKVLDAFSPQTRKRVTSYYYPGTRCYTTWTTIAQLAHPEQLPNLHCCFMPCLDGNPGPERGPVTMKHLEWLMLREPNPDVILHSLKGGCNRPLRSLVLPSLTHLILEGRVCVDSLISALAPCKHPLVYLRLVSASWDGRRCAELFRNLNGLQTLILQCANPSAMEAIVGAIVQSHGNRTTAILGSNATREPQMLPALRFIDFRGTLSDGARRTIYPLQVARPSLYARATLIPKGISGLVGRNGRIGQQSKADPEVKSGSRPVLASIGNRTVVQSL